MRASTDVVVDGAAEFLPELGGFDFCVGRSLKWVRAGGDEHRRLD
jgi:hypothetical protein